MSIEFKNIDNELIMCYCPEFDYDRITQRLLIGEEVVIKRTFCVTKNMIRKFDEDDYMDTLYVCIGNVFDKYTKIDSSVVGTEHDFYFSNDVHLKANMFTAHRNISILGKIDKVIERDFYIGGSWEKNNGISIELYMELLKKFPKTSELDKYAHNRIANIIKEQFPESDKYEKKFKKFIENKSKVNKNSYNLFDKNAYLEIELAQFSLAYKQLQEMLLSSEGVCESIWQEKIQIILQLLFPKYILCTREISFQGIDGYDKRPDFVLIDSNGFIDILEIKKPEVVVLTKQASYRNNYVPVREFSGAIQQIEKYIYCLNLIEKNKTVFDKLKTMLPCGVVPQVVNPQGILLLGRSNDFNEQQKRDFELIKRQYKNIADIMTYDDLLFRISNIINSLKQKI